MEKLPFTGEEEGLFGQMFRSLPLEKRKDFYDFCLRLYYEGKGSEKRNKKDEKDDD